MFRCQNVCEMQCQNAIQIKSHGTLYEHFKQTHLKNKRQKRSANQKKRHSMKTWGKKSRKCSCTWVPCVQETCTWWQYTYHYPCQDMQNLFSIIDYLCLHAIIFKKEHISTIHPCRQARNVQLIPKLFTSIRSDLKKVQRRNKSV